MKILSVLLAALALCGGCATPYAKQGYPGGYRETQYDRNVFKVTFAGNAYTTGERVQEFALLRSAELTLENGFKFFAISASSNDTEVGAVQMPTTATTTVAGNRATTTSYGGNMFAFAKPVISHVIICYNERPQDVATFDAEFLKTSLRKKYFAPDGRPLKQDTARSPGHPSMPRPR
jgi:hypothetical protein